MQKNIIIGVVIAVVFAGGGFYGGMKYNQSKTASATQNRFQQFAGRNGGAQGGQRMAGTTGAMPDGRQGFTGGEILSKDDKSITVKLRDGGSKIIFFSGSTQVTKSATGTPQDLITGTQVTVTGQANQDGSINAESIQIRPTPPSF